LLKDTNRLREAEPLARRAVSIMKASLVPGHPHIAIVVATHVSILRQLDRNEEADAIDP
jgi:hypothetical protein